jgi:hypothetical protein
VDEEWRVSLIVQNPLTIRKPVSANALRDLLRSRVGEEISVTAGKTGIFLYAAAADAAGTAERRAQEVLAEQGLAADIRLERWDLSRRAWVDVRTDQPGDATAPEVPPGHERNPGRRRLRSAGWVIAAIIDAISDGWPP